MHSTANSQQRNLMQGVAGGLRAEYAGVLRAPVPERLGRLMRRLDDDRAEHLVSVREHIESCQSFVIQEW